MFSEKFVIAIDGPAGSGKSTTASAVARKLDIVHLDTGAMYRALTLLAIEKGIATDNNSALGKIAQNMVFAFKRDGSSQQISVDSRNVTSDIRSEKVTSLVAKYCQSPSVREAMVAKQRDVAKDASVVLEGRDIGTVVFPDAKFKFFITASIEERAKRRMADFKKMGRDVTLDELMKEIADRDREDSTRAVSPLRKASDAVEIDTTGLTPEQQADKIVKIVKQGQFRSV
ncbi:MAG: (d)CMP kinase [Fibrobacteres bacterium]|nr:(d)CMP kinase [Fibrobacterota bacterium]